jgi:hypothetical protein
LETEVLAPRADAEEEGQVIGDGMEEVARFALVPRQELNEFKALLEKIARLDSQNQKHIGNLREALIDIKRDVMRLEEELEAKTEALAAAVRGDAKR